MNHANSWKPYWRQNGYFRIRFGEGGIDDSAVASSDDATYSNASRHWIGTSPSTKNLASPHVPVI